jgi:hypothetical protein
MALAATRYLCLEGVAASLASIELGSALDACGIPFASHSYPHQDWQAALRSYRRVVSSLIHSHPTFHLRYRT